MQCLGDDDKIISSPEINVYKNSVTIGHIKVNIFNANIAPKM